MTIVVAFIQQLISSRVYQKLIALLSVPESAVHNDIIHNDTSLPTQFYCSVNEKNLAVLLTVKNDAAVLAVFVSTGTIHSFVIDSRDGRCLCQNQLTAHGADVKKRNDVVAHPGNLQSCLQCFDLERTLDMRQRLVGDFQNGAISALCHISNSFKNFVCQLAVVGKLRI